MRSIGLFDLAAPCLTSLGGVFARAREVTDTAVAFHGSFSPRPLSLLPIHRR